ncbi:hypothetical protein CC78DRAFT_588022 [Lojkania enalia]|uniref:Uncharacterized protein n=1 Tax=Lojkania enalia TaxID=147567 RepID=A0A9P4MXR0_9PLEO|nr:hypothetical protein CC78DRAFT_588022 [Didymosphaeria enalia]
MFLTTNRFPQECLGELHQALSSEAAEVSGEDFAILAEDEMNGREIKNSIKTALVLAEHEDKPLKLEHLLVVLDIRKRLTTFERPDEERKVAKQH